MKVSVIVLTYNRESLVCETIDSILDQTFKDFELIVVDNCSQDGTEKLIQSYPDERIRYYKNENNGVIAVNRNYGIERSHGKYIAFCDDDDLWLPNKLEKQIAVFEEDPQVGLVCTGRVDLHQDREYPRRGWKDTDFTFKSLLLKNPITGSSVVISKDAIKHTGGFDTNPELFTIEDYDLWLRIAKEFRVKYLNLPLVKYRFHPGAWHKAVSWTRRERFQIFHKKLLEKGVIDEELYNWATHKMEHPPLHKSLWRLAKRFVIRTRI